MADDDDDLLGPKEDDRTKIKLANINGGFGTNKHEVVVVDVLSKKPILQKDPLTILKEKKRFVEEEVDGTKVKPLGSGTNDGKKQALLTSLKNVKEEGEDDKKKRAEEKKRQREEIVQTKISAEDRIKRERHEKEAREVKEFLENVEREKLRVEKEKRAKLEEEYVLEHDGTELPDKIKLSEQEWERLGMSAGISPGTSVTDDVLADAADKALSVKKYYADDLFPVETFATFITQAGNTPLNHCELGIVINGSWWRNKRFTTPDDLRQFLVSMKPERIEIGPIHPNHGTKKDPHSTLFLKRYLVFDIDLEDRTPEKPRGYIRGCRCKGSPQVCGRGCWFYVRTGIKCLTYLLRECFGAKYIVPVFSGRRGAHVYAIDNEFLAMQEDDRRGIVARVQLYGNPAEYVHPEHTLYLLEYILRPEFERVFLDGHRLIVHEDTLRMIREMVQGSTTEEAFVAALAQMAVANSLDQTRLHWNRLCSLVDARDTELSEQDRKTKGFEARFIFTVIYPRLDASVTTAMHHCIKAPFVIHPSTKRFSVPIPDLDKWYPEMAPRISEVVAAPVDPKMQSRFKSEWKEEADARRRAKVLEPYVEHLATMVHRAYPAKRQTIPKEFLMTAKRLSGNKGMPL